MKKFMLAVLVCVTLVGCGKKSDAVISNKAFGKEDIVATVETKAEEETTANVEATTQAAIATTEAETEPSFDEEAFKAELSKRIYDTWIYGYDVRQDGETERLINQMCDEDLDGSITWYYDYITLFGDFSAEVVAKSQQLGRVIECLRTDGDISVFDYGDVDVEYVKEDISVLDEHEAAYRVYVDESKARVAAIKESKAKAEEEAKAIVDSGALKIEWGSCEQTTDGMRFNGSDVSSAWYGVEVQSGKGNDGKTYVRGMFNNKNNDSKHLYVEWDYDNGQTYSVEVPVNSIEDCYDYYTNKD